MTRRRRYHGTCGRQTVIRVAVIGLGRMGRFYAQTLARLGPRVELYAVADPDPRARAAVQAELGLTRVFDRPEAVLALKEVDALVIATPTSTHAQVLIAAAQAGRLKAIFSEKPLALSLADTRAVIDAVESAGILLQVGFMRRFDPGYRQAYDSIKAGQIGRPVTFKGVGRDPTCPPLDYANPAHSGGLVVDMGIHDFDLARWLMSSEVVRVSAEGTLLACDQLAAFGDIDNAVINLRFENGAIGNVDLSRNARYGYDVRTEVLGTDGAIIVGGLSEPAVNGVQQFAPAAAQVDDTPFFVRRFAAAYTAEIEYFVDCLEQGQQPSVGGKDALAAIEIAQAATLSWQSGRPVALAELRATASA
jgi:inositol 2-dehydrogenase